MRADPEWASRRLSLTMVFDNSAALNRKHRPGGKQHGHHECSRYEPGITRTGAGRHRQDRSPRRAAPGLARRSDAHHASCDGGMTALAAESMDRALVLVLLGSAIMAGVFFTFSNFVMPALARIEWRAGMAAMRSINVTVLNRVFLGIFIGTAVLSAIVALDAGLRFRGAASWLTIFGALCYVVGTFLVTGLGNVPLNDRLAALDPDDPGAQAFWHHYLQRWTSLNGLRAVASACAMTLFLAALLFGAGAERRERQATRLNS